VERRVGKKLALKKGIPLLAGGRPGTKACPLPRTRGVVEDIWEKGGGMSSARITLDNKWTR